MMTPMCGRRRPLRAGARERRARRETSINPRRRRRASSAVGAAAVPRAEVGGVIAHTRCRRAKDAVGEEADTSATERRNRVARRLARRIAMTVHRRAMTERLHQRIVILAIRGDRRRGMRAGRRYRRAILGDRRRETIDALRLRPPADGETAVMIGTHVDVARRRENLGTLGDHHHAMTAIVEILGVRRRRAGTTTTVLRLGTTTTEVEDTPMTVVHRRGRITTTETVVTIATDRHRVGITTTADRHLETTTIEGRRLYRETTLEALGLLAKLRA